MVSRLQIARDIFSTWKARLLVAVPLFIAVYQFACDQIGFPTLPTLWHMTGLPWWAWLFFAQTGVLYGLFEYVRRIPEGAPVLAAADSGNRDLQILDEISRTRRDVIFARGAGGRRENEMRDALPRLTATFVTLNKAYQLPFPKLSIANLDRSMKAGERYLTDVEPFLRQGHVDEARECAESLTPILNDFIAGNRPQTS